MLITSSKYFRNREHGDDRFFRYKKKGVRVFGVLDGVSCASGAVASQLATKWIKRRKPTTIEEVVESIQAFHDWITRHLGDTTQTTIAVAILSKGKIEVASVGDSPVYLVDNNGCSIAQVNELDSWPDDPAVVTQVVGADDIEVNVSELKLPRKGFVLLCSDGVSDNLSMEDLFALCVGMPRARTVVKRLRQTMRKLRKTGKGHVYDSFKPDDETAVVVRFS